MMMKLQEINLLTTVKDYSVLFTAGLLSVFAAGLLSVFATGVSLFVVGVVVLESVL